MNGRIMIGLGAGVMAWGATAILYEEGLTGVVLFVLGVAVFVIGLRQSRKS